MFRKISAAVAAVLLLICVDFCVHLIGQARLTARPLTMAISLKPGSIQTPEFQTGRVGHDYDLDLSFDQKFDRVPSIRRALRDNALRPSGHPRLKAIMCVLGAEDQADRCGGITSVIDFTWQIYENGKVIAKGSTRSYTGFEEADGQVIRPLGEFRARAGHRYRVGLQVTRDASELDVANPRIVVQIPYSYRNDIGMANGFQLAGAVIFGLFGLTFLFLAIRESRQPRKKSL